MLTVSAKQLKKENQKKGIFHTNEKLALYLKTRMLDYVYEFKYGKITEIADLCCGAGSLLKVFNDDAVKYGCDIEASFIKEADKNIKGTFKCDSIFNEPFGNKRFKYITGNYPFSTCGDGKAVTQQLSSPVEFSNRLDSAFIYANLKALTEDGLCLLLGFPGILYRSGKEKVFRKYLIDNNYLEAIEEIPADKEFFDDTVIQTVLMVLRKNKTDDKITFINQHGEKRAVLKKEIIENDYSLTVNSYIEHLTQKEEIDIQANTYTLIASSIHNIVRNTELLELTDMLEHIEENKSFANMYINMISCFCDEYKKDRKSAAAKYRNISVT